MSSQRFCIGIVNVSGIILLLWAVIIIYQQLPSTIFNDVKVKFSEVYCNSTTDRKVINDIFTATKSLFEPMVNLTLHDEISIIYDDKLCSIEERESRELFPQNWYPLPIIHVLLTNTTKEKKDSNIIGFAFLGLPVAFIEKESLRPDVLAHEIGHTFGLEHSPDVTNIMFPSSQVGTTFTTSQKETMKYFLDGLKENYKKRYINLVLIEVLIIFVIFILFITLCSLLFYSYKSNINNIWSFRYVSVWENSLYIQYTLEFYDKYRTKEKMQNEKIFSGLSVFLAYTMMNPLMEDIQDTFGKPVLYHPFAIWLCLIMLVYTQTSSITTGIIIVLLYEIVKIIWRTFTPEPPVIGQLRKLIHRIQNNEPLSDNDIKFLDNITPSNVSVLKRNLN